MKGRALATGESQPKVTQVTSRGTSTTAMLSAMRAVVFTLALVYQKRLATRLARTPSPDEARVATSDRWHGVARPLRRADYLWLQSQRAALLAHAGPELRGGLCVHFDGVRADDDPIGRSGALWGNFFLD